MYHSYWCCNFYCTQWMPYFYLIKKKCINLRFCLLISLQHSYCVKRGWMENLILSAPFFIILFPCYAGWELSSSLFHRFSPYYFSALSVQYIFVTYLNIGIDFAMSVVLCFIKVLFVGMLSLSSVIKLWVADGGSCVFTPSLLSFLSLLFALPFLY